VLEDRQRILFPSGSEQEPVADRRLYRTTIEHGRFVNGAEDAEIIQVREQILAGIDGLSEALKAGAFAEIIGAHRKYNEKVRRGVLFAGYGTERWIRSSASSRLFCLA
jgi:hypothetical protein